MTTSSTDNTVPQSLTGKRILITGAAKRIGKAMATYFAARGARVLLHYGGSRQEAEQVAAACAWEGQPAPLLQADLSQVSEVMRLFAAVRALGEPLDCLVNNAARFTRIPAWEVTEADWDHIHSVNLKAVFFCCQQAALIMRDQATGGRIVNISSLGGLRPWAEHAHYCASKAGVIHMTRALAKAFAPNITVNSIAPGVIPFEEREEPRILAGIQMTPAGRAGSGQDIAEAAEWLFTNRGFVTGQTIALDGGLNLV
ncbi:MAG: SDR family oxidoreductase [Bryobacterales bacterium]|jgi:3-oxoacyl-[acyl-carrier protein] reductase/pteridine reductase|nr:SDR family oxidoreductase [Bryobacterales bacterium]